MYNKRPARTRLISSTMRVPVATQPPHTVTKQPGSKAHQCGSAGVFRFVPDPRFKCCKRKCMSYFESEEDDRVLDSRRPLYDTLVSTDTRRAQLRTNWRNTLRLDDGHAVCLTCACKIYACSRAMLCPQPSNKGVHMPGDIGRSKAESNAARATKSVCISAWFQVLKETLDIMPDTGYYQLQHPRKGMVFDEYKLDAACWPALYQECDPSYFYQVWRESFPNVKLRKHCRFAKCDFCLEQRGVISAPTAGEAEKGDARDRLKLHLAWAHTRERGFYHSKRDEAIRCPSRKLSISIDGTDQFINGFPHFWEIGKRDSKGKRFYIHTQVSIVHGVGPSVYLGLEDIAGDPNWTIETLYRTLKAEEERRNEGLPRTLYLQLDNCFRENKNTYVIAYLCWLVERLVFDEVFLSFLPTGHTHFDPDQFASRIAVAVRYRDVLTCAEYARLIAGCWGHQVPVEWVDDVMDHKQLFNPGKDDNCPVSVSRVRRVRGIGTKSVQPGRDWWMSATSPLHWRMRRDANGHTFVQSKFTCDDTSWGQPFYPWTDAPRPGNRAHDHKTSGLFPADVVLAPNNPLSDARKKELQAAIQNVKHRLTEAQWEEAQELLETVTTPRTTEMPEGHGTLVGDFADLGDVQEEEAHLFARPTTVFASQSHQNRAREQRKTQGHASNVIVTDKFIAYTPHYAPTYPKDKLQKFWVGKVRSVDADEGQVEIARWHTNTVDNLEGQINGTNSAKYRVWTGKGPTQEWIDVSRVLEVFDLTPKKIIEKKYLRLIRTALVLVETMRANPEGAPDVAVGHDVFENPRATVASEEQELIDQANEQADFCDDDDD